MISYRRDSVVGAALYFVVRTGYLHTHEVFSRKMEDFLFLFFSVQIFSVSPILQCMEIVFFDDDIEQHISKFEKPTVAKVLHTIDLLEIFGNRLGMPHSKKISPGLFELRVRGKEEVRIIYCFHQNKAVLLYTFIKKSRSIPKRFLLLAQKRLHALAGV